MALKYPIYVSNITNLSDARYCAGMGVDILGFCVDESDANYISNEKILGITGWVTGIKVAIETSYDTLIELESKASELGANYITTSYEYHQGMNSSSKELIYNIKWDDMPEVLPPAGSTLIIQITKEELAAKKTQLSQIGSNYKIYLQVNEADGVWFLENIEVVNAYGIALRGGTELEPGLRNFDELAEILETLEVES